MDKLLAKLTEQEAVISQQNAALKNTTDDNVYSRALDSHHASSGTSLPLTPATDTFPNTAPTTRPASANLNEPRSRDEELLRLKLELAQAQNKISHLNRELNQNRVKQEDTTAPIFNGSRIAQPVPRSNNNNWPPLEDSQSDTSDVISTNNGFTTRGIWSGGRRNQPPIYGDSAQQPPVSDDWLRGNGLNGGYMDPNGPYGMMDGYRSERVTPDPDNLMRPIGGRRGNRFDSQFDNRCASRPNPWSAYRPPPYTHCDNMNMNPMLGGPNSMASAPMSVGTYSPFSTPGLGTPLSPHATEFTSTAPWKSEVCQRQA
jgi:hypothetical protein